MIDIPNRGTGTGSGTGTGGGSSTTINATEVLVTNNSYNNQQQLNNYLVQQITNLTTTINNLDVIPYWSASVMYQPGTTVKYLDSDGSLWLYECLDANMGNVPEYFVDTYWKRIGQLVDAAGESGIPYWDNTTNYVQFQIVRFVTASGILYLFENIVEGPNYGNWPDPEDQTYWRVIGALPQEQSNGLINYYYEGTFYGPGALVRFVNSAGDLCIYEAKFPTIGVSPNEPAVWKYVGRTHVALADVDGLADVITTINNAITNIQNQGAAISDWTPGTHYTPGKIVSYGCCIYRCLVEHDSTASFAADFNNVGNARPDWWQLKGEGSQQALVNVAGNALTLNGSLGNVQFYTLNGSSAAFTVSGHSNFLKLHNYRLYFLQPAAVVAGNPLKQLIWPAGGFIADFGIRPEMVQRASGISVIRAFVKDPATLELYTEYDQKW